MLVSENPLSVYAGANWERHFLFTWLALYLMSSWVQSLSYSSEQHNTQTGNTVEPVIVVTHETSILATTNIIMEMAALSSAGISATGYSDCDREVAALHSDHYRLHCILFVTSQWKVKCLTSLALIRLWEEYTKNFFSKSTACRRTDWFLSHFPRSECILFSSVDEQKTWYFPSEQLKLINLQQQRECFLYLRRSIRDLLFQRNRRHFRERYLLVVRQFWHTLVRKKQRVSMWKEEKSHSKAFPLSGVGHS